MIDARERHLVPIPAQRLPEYLPQVSHWLQSFADRSRGKCEVADAIKRLVAGEMQLWGVGSPEGLVAAGLTELTNYPRKRVGRIVAFAGEDANSWAWVVTPIEHWARCEGATAMELIARPGWEKLMRPYGYQKTHVTFEKDL